MGVRVKYGLLIVIGDKKQTKTESKYFFEKDRFLSYSRRNSSIILECRLWDMEDNITPCTLEELQAAEWRIYHPQKPVKEKKPKQEPIAKPKVEKKPKIEERKVIVFMPSEINILNDCIAKQSAVEIYMVNGFCIKGIITGFDNAVVIVADNKGKIHMIYKHAISTITR